MSSSEFRYDNIQPSLDRDVRIEAIYNIACRWPSELVKQTELREAAVAAGLGSNHTFYRDIKILVETGELEPVKLPKGRRVAFKVHDLKRGDI